MGLALAGYLVRHWAAYRLSGARRPLLGGLKLTHRCNLHCAPCPFWRRPRPDMSYAAVRQALDALYGAGCRLLIVEGGEPFLWRDGNLRLEDVVAAARARGFARVGVTTNGSFPIEIRSDLVWVSIDGLRATHEAVRGAGWDRVMANIAASRHPRLYAQVTIHRRNWQEMPELVRHLAGRVRGITFQFFYPYAESNDFWLPWPERRTVLGQLRDLKRQGYPLLDSYRTLRDLEDNRWRCHDWLMANAEPSPDDPGRPLVHSGCYLKGRADADCARCGFSAHAEISSAYDLHPGALWTGQKVFRLV